MSAETPGITSTCGSARSHPESASVSYMRPAMPYMPGSPLETSETVLPDEARSMHCCARSTSCVMAYLCVSLPAIRSATKLTYVS